LGPDFISLYRYIEHIVSYRELLETRYKYRELADIDIRLVRYISDHTADMDILVEISIYIEWVLSSI
jgi:hypothetical protein